MWFKVGWLWYVFKRGEIEYGFEASWKIKRSLTQGFEGCGGNKAVTKTVDIRRPEGKKKKKTMFREEPKLLWVLVIYKGSWHPEGTGLLSSRSSTLHGSGFENKWKARCGAWSWDHDLSWNQKSDMFIGHLSDSVNWAPGWLSQLSTCLLAQVMTTVPKSSPTEGS